MAMYSESRPVLLIREIHNFDVNMSMTDYEIVHCLGLGLPYL